jgi:hypothetical protein
MRRLCLTLLAVAVCSGCFRATTTITVKQDGSGTLDQEIGATAQAMAMLRNFSGGDQKSADVQMFGPEQAQALAASMGVRFVSGEPVKTATLEGYRAHFAFDDVSKIKLNIKTPTGPGAEAQESEEPPLAFGFTKGDAASILTIKVAEQKPGTAGLLPQLPGGGGSPDEQAQALAMLMPMLRGMYVDVSLVVDGRVIKTNAPYVNGSAVTLMEFDFDKVNATEGAIQKLQQITDPKQLKDIPGVRMLTDPLVTIEFGR